MPFNEPDITREDFETWLDGDDSVNPPVPGLKSLVEKVRETNTKWFNHLKDEFDNFESDGDNKAKIIILENLDEALAHSFGNITPPSDNPNTEFTNESTTLLDEALGGLLIEIEGYKRLSDRYFNNLLKLSETDRQLKRTAYNARITLLKQLETIQRWLQEKKGGINSQEKLLAITPSEFDACTDKFLVRLQNLGLEPDSNVLGYTQELFRNRRLVLGESQLKRLIDAWGDVVSSFIKDTQDTDDPFQSSDPDIYEFGEPATIADFICMHERLDTLYSRLATNVSRD